eukprot:2058328-Amphidinium_carterae.1
MSEADFNATCEHWGMQYKDCPRSPVEWALSKAIARNDSSIKVEEASVVVYEARQQRKSNQQKTQRRNSTSKTQKRRMSRQQAQQAQIVAPEVLFEQANKLEDRALEYQSIQAPQSKNHSCQSEDVCVL